MNELTAVCTVCVSKESCANHVTLPTFCVCADKSGKIGHKCQGGVICDVGELQRVEERSEPLGTEPQRFSVNAHSLVQVMEESRWILGHNMLDA